MVTVISSGLLIGVLSACLYNYITDYEYPQD